MTVARGVAAGIAAVACAAALAQPADDAARRAVEQKEALVRRLVFDPPVEQRIDASGSEEARREFARARARHARARALADAGDLRGAQEELNGAMAAVMKARQLVPDPAARAIDQRRRVAGLQRTVETLSRSYEGHVARLQGSPAGEAALQRVAAFRASQDEARALAADGHLEEAARALERTERELLSGISAVLGSSTLRYAQRFDTPADEYAFEVERNRSYQELVPLALAELKPRREAVTLVERYVAENARQLEAAQAHAAAGRLPQALDAVKAGTNNLQAALAAAGLAVPRHMGAQ